MRARFLAVWQCTLPSKGFGMEMQFGSRANISHQPPVGSGLCGSEALSPVASSSSKFHQHQPHQSATGPCLGTHTKARNKLTNTRVEKMVAVRANLCFFFSRTTSHPQQVWIVTVKTRPQSLMFKRWTLRKFREKTWKTTKA